ncbi:TPA: hypothetical protein ACQ7G1_002999, partial [Klebsiella pneumoniae]
CMHITYDLHAFGLPYLKECFHSCWDPSMIILLHQNRSIKRAGEAGKAPRARLYLRIYFRSLSASLCRTGSR